ncbi:MAG: hypothetical protein ACK4YQ_02060 [Phenylobacterium sp.]|uniref:hypothetical protein n=1 Tax=Phenylobacterium sp. TaxID=1871053 RepID=UPI003918BF48
MTWKTLRTVIHELDVSVLVDALTERHPRFAEVWEGIEWLLARTPDLKGSARREGAENIRIHPFAGDELAGTPDVWVVYKFDDNEVVILGVTVPDPVEGAEGAGDT